MRIAYGKNAKNQPGKLTVTFPQPFYDIPNVVITPHWDNQNENVGNVETITEITKNDFAVVSPNFANNYYIQWIAVSDE